MTWEYDFLATAAKIFQLFVLILLPVTGLGIFLVYLKKILTAYFETQRLKLKARSKRR